MKRHLCSGKISLQEDSNPRSLDPKSVALTTRPRGRFSQSRRRSHDRRSGLNCQKYFQNLPSRQKMVSMADHIDFITGYLYKYSPQAAVKTTGHLKCICTSCFLYFRKTGSPSHNFSVVKKLPKEVTLQILNFISVS